MQKKDSTARASRKVSPWAALIAPPHATRSAARSYVPLDTDALKLAVHDRIQKSLLERHAAMFGAGGFRYKRAMNDEMEFVLREVDFFLADKSFDSVLAAAAAELDPPGCCLDILALLDEVRGAWHTNFVNLANPSEALRAQASVENVRAEVINSLKTAKAKLSPSYHDRLSSLIASIEKDSFSVIGPEFQWRGYPIDPNLQGKRGGARGGKHKSAWRGIFVAKLDSILPAPLKQDRAAAIAKLLARAGDRDLTRQHVNGILKSRQKVARIEKL